MPMAHIREVHLCVYLEHTIAKASVVFGTLTDTYYTLNKRRSSLNSVVFIIVIDLNKLKNYLLNPCLGGSRLNYKALKTELSALCTISNSRDFLPSVLSFWHKSYSIYSEWN